MSGKKERFEITMHVYSGRPNPRWYVDDSQPQFRELYARLAKHPATDLPQRLGYRGFLIERQVTDKSGNVTKHPVISVAGNNDLEKFILGTATADVGDGLKKHAEEIINENVSKFVFVENLDVEEGTSTDSQASTDKNCPTEQQAPTDKKFAPQQHQQQASSDKRVTTDKQAAPDKRPATDKQAANVTDKKAAVDKKQQSSDKKPVPEKKE